MTITNVKTNSILPETGSVVNFGNTDLKSTFVAVSPSDLLNKATGDVLYSAGSIGPIGPTGL